MKVLTSAGLKKLRDLKNKLVVLQSQAKGTESKGDSKEIKGSNISSEYSRKMVQAVIDIIKRLIEQNDVSYWKEGKNQKWLKDQLDVLDMGKRSYVPEVFNQESRQLAENILQILETTKFSDFFETGISILLSKVVGDFEKFIGVLKQTLDSRIRFHEIVSLQEKAEVKIAKEQYSIISSDLINKSDKLTSEIKKLKDNKSEIKKLLMQYENDFNKTIPELLKLLSQIPYININTEDGLVSGNAEFPYLSNTLDSRGQRAMQIWMLIGVERAMNKERLKVGLPIITLVYDHFSKKFSQSKLSDLKARFKQIAEEFKATATFYKQGKHLGMFKSVDKEKKEQVDLLVSFVNEKLEAKNFEKLYPSTGLAAFKVYAEMVKANSENRAIAQRKNISPGELSRLLEKQSEKFLMLSINCVDETCDSGVLDQLNEYEKALNLPITAVPSVPAEEKAGMRAS